MNRHTNKPLQGDKRLYDRFALVGNFYVGEQNVKYTVVDVSLGGLKIKPAETNTNSHSPQDLISGLMVLRTGSLFVASKISCKVIVSEVNGFIRAKFVDVSEELVDFLRNSRVDVNSNNLEVVKSQWLPETPIYNNHNKSHGTIVSRIFQLLTGVELVLIFLAIVLGAFFIARSGEDQSILVQHNHQIVAKLDGSLLSLVTEFPVETGSTIATLSAETVSGDFAELSVNTPVTAHDITWKFNVGDHVKRSDILGVAHNVATTAGKPNAVVGFRHVLFSADVGDILAFSGSDKDVILGKVLRIIPRSQAVIAADLDTNDLAFNYYYYVELDYSISKARNDSLKMNHIRTLFIKVKNYFGG